MNIFYQIRLNFDKSICVFFLKKTNHCFVKHYREYNDNK